jgi:hypothetical protein
MSGINSLLSFEAGIFWYTRCPWERGWSPKIQIWERGWRRLQVAFPNLKSWTPAQWPTAFPTPVILPENSCFRTYLSLNEKFILACE